MNFFDDNHFDNAPHRRRCRQVEHEIQAACVRWFRVAYPALALRLIAVPNGGKRDTITARKFKDEGVLAGVADLMLLRRTSAFGALMIEMKTAVGHQSPAQKVWQEDITKEGEYKYVVCRSLEDFQREVTDYLT